MTFLESIKKMNVPGFLQVVFILCTIVSGFYAAIPVYEPPSFSVVTEEIPEHHLDITNNSWVQPERILLAI